MEAANDGTICQTLAAGPELVTRWAQADDPYASALITAAIDARRLRLRASCRLAYSVTPSRDTSPTINARMRGPTGSSALSGTPKGRCETSSPLFDTCRSTPVSGRKRAWSGLPTTWNTKGVESDPTNCRRRRSGAQRSNTLTMPPLARLWLSPPITWAIDGSHSCCANAPRPPAIHTRCTTSGGTSTAAVTKTQRCSWLIRSMRTGDSHSVQSYEFFLEKSKRDLSASIPYWTIAAENDNTFAIGRLAHLLERLDRHEEALRWWRRGHELADSHCADALAGRLFRGWRSRLC